MLPYYYFFNKDRNGKTLDKSCGSCYVNTNKPDSKRLNGPEKMTLKLANWK